MCSHTEQKSSQSLPEPNLRQSMPQQAAHINIAIRVRHNGLIVAGNQIQSIEEVKKQPITFFKGAQFDIQSTDITANKY